MSESPQQHEQKSNQDFSAFIAIAGWQKCWDQVNKKSGVTVQEQYKKYEASMKRYSITKMSDEMVTFEDESTSKFLGRINKVETIPELQNALVVRNCNEFRLRDKPTDIDIDNLIKDYRATALKGGPMGVSDKYSQLQTKVNQACSVVKQQFFQLNARK